MQELLERLGIQKLNERLNDPNMQGFFESIFPKDHPKNMRFAIKFFMAHGLGVITEGLLEKMMPLTIEQHQPASSGSESEPSSDDSASSGSESEPNSDDGN
jgi:pre-mRNA-splicing factor CWC22